MSQSNAVQLSEESTSRYAQITVDGESYKIHYNEAGEGEALIMLHGSGPGSSGWSNFHRNIGPLAEAGYRVILLDFIGWNKSDPVVCKELRMDFNAKVLKAFVDELKIDKASLVGNSMGGGTSLSFILQWPERVNKLIIMGAGGIGPSITTPMPAEGIKLLYGLYKDPSYENLRKMLDVFVYDPSSLTEELITGRHNNMMENKEHLENFVESLKYTATLPDMASRLGEIKSPTLVTWGRDDRFVPLDLGLRMLWGINDVELHIFSQCGHWAQWEHADKFNRLLIEFLGRQ